MLIGQLATLAAIKDIVSTASGAEMLITEEGAAVLGQISGFLRNSGNKLLVAVLHTLAAMWDGENDQDGPLASRQELFHRLNLDTRQ